jgi:predicted enzyme related to lactoylglutathione lyase
MTSERSFSSFTVQFSVPDFRAGLEFYSRLFGRKPEFEPYEDFAEWEAVENVWFQLGEGDSRPTHPARFRVNDIETVVEWVQRELGVRCSQITRIPGLVAFCDFRDPWGNNLGFYQRLWVHTARVPGGRSHDDETRQ